MVDSVDLLVPLVWRPFDPEGPPSAAACPALVDDTVAVVAVSIKLD